MHEMAIAVQIVEIASAAVPPGMAAGSVERVNLRIGRLTAVVPESLRFCFEVVSRDTALSGAELHIDDVPIVAECRACGALSDIDEPPFVCSACGDGSLNIVSGRELTVTSIEVADDPPAAEEQWKSS